MDVKRNGDFRNVTNLDNIIVATLNSLDQCCVYVSGSTTLSDIERLVYLETRLSYPSARRNYQGQRDGSFRPASSTSSTWTVRPVIERQIGYLIDSHAHKPDLGPLDAIRRMRDLRPELTLLNLQSGLDKAIDQKEKAWLESWTDPNKILNLNADAGDAHCCANCVTQKHHSSVSTLILCLGF